MLITVRERNGSSKYDGHAAPPWRVGYLRRAVSHNSWVDGGDCSGRAVEREALVSRLARYVAICAEACGMVTRKVLIEYAEFVESTGKVRTRPV